MYLSRKIRDIPRIMKSTEDKILRRIYSHGRGWVFTPRHFDDIAGSTNITTAIQRLHKKGKIRKLARGLYDYPIHDDLLGELQPSIEAIAKALSGRDAIRLQASGAYAANLLGLSTQVPMKVVYLTDGRSRSVVVGNQEISLKQTSPRMMATAGKISGLLIQGLRHIGKNRINDTIIEQLESRLDEKNKEQLLKDITYAPAWIADIFRKLAKQEGQV